MDLFNSFEKKISAHIFGDIRLNRRLVTLCNQFSCSEASIPSMLANRHQRKEFVGVYYVVKQLKMNKQRKK